MPALQVGSLTVPVASLTVTFEEVATYRRRWDGTLEVEQRGTFGRARVWDVVTPPMARTDADTLESALLVAGTLELSGDEVPGGAQTCYLAAGSLERADRRGRGTTPTGDLSTLRFRAAGVDG